MDKDIQRKNEIRDHQGDEERKEPPGSFSNLQPVGGREVTGCRRVGAAGPDHHRVGSSRRDAGLS